MSDKECGFESWELRKPKSNAERRKEWWADRDEEAQRKQTERELYRTRSQWRAAGRMVIVGDDEAIKTVTSRTNGHVLHLFHEQQTRERTPEELERDACRG